ncbi:MAG: thiamine-phosphate kinase [Candidatus Aminicenantes bacterium]|nr:thiamine-phosphate kinase [Candidatus Aminicenantes bacterium]
MSKRISDIGEFGLIDRIHKLLQKEGIRNTGVALDMGDDAASILPRAGYELLITCDVLVEDRHYLPGHTGPYDLGRRAMTVNISDIGAMGGLPLYALVSLGLKGNTPVREVERMYQGFLRELNPFEASIIGGNLTSVETAGFIDITLIGEVRIGKCVRRSTAKTGDVILVTGYPGQAAAGLQLLRRSKRTEKLDDHPLVRAYKTPTHRAREGHAVAQTGAVHAMIDTSDGLLADLGHICKESGVGAVLNQEELPLAKELRLVAQHFERDPYELILEDSDDYELIITCPEDRANEIVSTIAAVSDAPVTEVGRIYEPEKGILLKSPNGSLRRLALRGWDHFKT